MNMYYEYLQNDFVFNYGETVLMWNLFVTAAHSGVQFKNEMDGVAKDQLEKDWKQEVDRTILSQFAKKFRPDLREEFDALVDRRNELVHQPIKDMGRLLNEASLADPSRPISDEDMRSLVEKQQCFKAEVKSYTDIVMGLLKPVAVEYEQWKKRQ